MFLIGVNIYNYQDKIYLKKEYLFFSILILIYFAITNKLFLNYVYLFLVPYILFYFAYIPKGIIRNFNKIGDYSYGIYIYAFPIQQIVIYNYPTISFPMFVAISIITTLLFSVLSWHFVEKPVLNFKKKVSPRLNESLLINLVKNKFD